MNYMTECVCCKKEFDFTKVTYYWINLNMGSADYMFCSKDCVFEYVKNHIVRSANNDCEV